MGWTRKPIELKKDMFILYHRSYILIQTTNPEKYKLGFHPQKYWLYATPVSDIRRRARIANKCGCKFGWRIKIIS